MGCAIIGCGKSLPALVVSNDDLTQLVDTSDEWITTRTGIKSRRIAVGETNVDLAEAAARQAMGLVEGGYCEAPRGVFHVHARCARALVRGARPPSPGLGERRRVRRERGVLGLYLRDERGGIHDGGKRGGRRGRWPSQQGSPCACDRFRAPDAHHQLGGPHDLRALRRWRRGCRGRMGRGPRGRARHLHEERR